MAQGSRLWVWRSLSLEKSLPGSSPKVLAPPRVAAGLESRLWAFALALDKAGFASFWSRLQRCLLGQAVPEHSSLRSNSSAPKLSPGFIFFIALV